MKSYNRWIYHAEMIEGLRYEYWTRNADGYIAVIVHDPFDVADMYECSMLRKFGDRIISCHQASTLAAAKQWHKMHNNFQAMSADIAIRRVDRK